MQIGRRSRRDAPGKQSIKPGEVDQRGSRGVQGVRPYFNWVKLRIRVHTDEPEERFERLIRNVEYRCPVMNLFESADVEMNVIWKTRSRQQGAA